MTNKIGVLGSSTATVLGTATAYTCPAGKAAKVKIMFRMQGNAAGGTTLDMLVNNLVAASIAAMTANFYVFSTRGAGLRVAEQAAQPLGTTAALSVAPADQVYYLSAGQTIQYTIGGAAAIAMSFQVVGTEIDIT